MPKKYLELDSNYRNRNLYPNQSCFGVPISQSGLKNQYNALDPVTSAYPIQSFIIADEYISGNTYGNYNGDLAVSATGKFLFSVGSTGPSSNILQPNYYVGAVIYSKEFPIVASRIIEWKYITTILDNYIFSVLVDKDIPPQYANNPTSMSIGNLSNITTGTVQHIFIPASISVSNIYYDFYIFNQNPESNPRFTQVNGFDAETNLITAVCDISKWKETDVLILRKTLPNIYDGSYSMVNTIKSKISVGKYNICGLYNNGNAIVSNSFYINSFVRYYQDVGDFCINVTRIVGIVLEISGGDLESPMYVIDTTGNVYTQYVNNGFTVSYSQYIATQDAIPIGYNIEIMQYTNDNFSPFVYNGTLTSQNQPVSYEVSLNSITLPNVILTTGGRIAYYPYVYVEIENVGSSSSNINTIYSNNPNTYKAVFKILITDLNNPSTTPFVRLTGNGFLQTIPFKINCDMIVTVKLPNGTILETKQKDTMNGQTPDQSLQISLVFEINRI